MSICSKPPAAGSARALPGVAAAILAPLATLACEPSASPEPASMTLSPAEVEFGNIGDTVRLTTRVRDEDGRMMADYEVSWSASDASVATVSPSGLVRAESVGAAAIAATVGSAFAEAPVRVFSPDRDPLTVLFRETGGWDWKHRRGWLTDDPVSEWYGVDTNARGRVVKLSLSGNRLAGRLPPEIGELTKLRELRLDTSEMAGPLPEQIGDMASLAHLDLTNSGLFGPLPRSITGLDSVTVLRMDGTGLCAPAGYDFQKWLAGIPIRRVASCAASQVRSTAYLTQAVQSRTYPVPLVAGEAALLRVFVVAPAAAGDTVPLVRATFHPGDAKPVVVEIEPGNSFIRDTVDEGSLESSANALIPASLIQPGLEMVVEIDPDSTTDPSLGVSRRIPETGRWAVDVREMPELELTLIPFLWRQRPDSTILEITDGLTADSELLRPIAELLPVAKIDLEIHDPVVTNSLSLRGLLAHAGAIRAAEGGTGYYMGTMTGRAAGGIATLPGWTSYSSPDSSIMVHELGHNMHLFHAPCGRVVGSDPSFPQPDGTIGTFGYDRRTNSLVEPTIPDLMSYCHPHWISEYHFSKAIGHRLTVEEPMRRAGRAAFARALLIVGGVDRNGAPHLEPVFVIDAPPSRPRAEGAHRLTGTTEDGAELFALNFAMPEITSGDGSSAFAFVVPVQSGWTDTLARITLSGPDGSVALDAGTDRPAAIMRHPRTGKVRAILTDLPAAIRTVADAARLAPEPGLEVLFSRGIPDAAAWRR